MKHALQQRADSVLALARKADKKLATVESCTAGSLAVLLAAAEGAAGLKRHGNNGSNGFIAHCFSPLGEAVCSASTQCRLARANFRRGINGIIWRKGSDIRDFA